MTQRAYDKCIWQIMITNSKWSFKLKFSFWRILKSWENLNPLTVNPSQILSFQKKTTEVPNRVYATLFMVKVSQRICFQNNRIIGDEAASFLVSAKHIFLLWSKKLSLAMEIQLLSRNYGSIRQSFSKHFMYLGT